MILRIVFIQVTVPCLSLVSTISRWNFAEIFGISIQNYQNLTIFIQKAHFSILYLNLGRTLETLHVFGIIVNCTCFFCGSTCLSGGELGSVECVDTVIGVTSNKGETIVPKLHNNSSITLNGPFSIQIGDIWRGRGITAIKVFHGNNLRNGYGKEQTNSQDSKDSFPHRKLYIVNLKFKITIELSFNCGRFITTILINYDIRYYLISTSRAHLKFGVYDQIVIQANEASYSNTHILSIRLNHIDIISTQFIQNLYLVIKRAAAIPKQANILSKLFFQLEQKIEEQYCRALLLSQIIQTLKENCQALLDSSDKIILPIQWINQTNNFPTVHWFAAPIKYLIYYIQSAIRYARSQCQQDLYLRLGRRTVLRLCYLYQKPSKSKEGFLDEKSIKRQTLPKQNQTMIIRKATQHYC